MQEFAIAPDMDECNSYSMEPSDRIERDGPGMADDDKPFESFVDPAKSARIPSRADATLENKVAAFDRHTDAVPTQHENSVASDERLGHCHFFFPSIFLGCSDVIEPLGLRGQSTRAYGLVEEAAGSWVAGGRSCQLCGS